jgi:hypothetical protein
VTTTSKMLIDRFIRSDAPLLNASLVYTSDASNNSAPLVFD